jgi:hypothetical protein
LCGGNRNAYKILIGIPEGSRLFRGQKRRFKWLIKSEGLKIQRMVAAGSE